MTFFKRRPILAIFLLPMALLAGGVRPAAAEVILQYFNTSWRELADKMPELAEAGYGSLWLPPPTKGSGGLSVGYDLWDPFDLGSRDQRSTVRTRYGTEEELLRLIQVAHRFGIRVYFDNIMNHRAFDVPGYNETTPIDVYPGLVPEDFHLRVTEDGFYRKWDNVANWNDAWQVQNRNFSDLIDIAHETPNANFGGSEGSTYPKVRLLRQPNFPEFYDWHPTLGRVGFYNSNITAGVLASNALYENYNEDVWMYLMRSVRWLVDRTKVDGLRLDAVKHVPSYFFGAQGAGKDTSTDGYTGQAQEQFNVTRGFSDANHRDTVFNTENPRDDLMMFGEHLGSPPGFQEYVDAGMRLVDANLRNELNHRFGNPSASLAGLDTPGFSADTAFNQFTGVSFAKSHDDDYATRTELHYGYYLTRAGLPNIYTDGNYQSETLAQSGGAFPRHANTAFLGQFSDNRIPNLVYIHNHFARGDQYTLWSDGDFVAYQRVDKRENGGMSDTDGVVLLFMLNDNYASGVSRAIANNNLKFGHTPFVDDAYLYNYSSYGGGFYVYASQLGSTIVPPGGYFAFSWRTPEESDPWKAIGGKPVAFYENEQPVGSVSYVRKDGPNGDANFNPYGVAGDTPNDFSYTWSIPRVTSATNLRFAARVDGSAVDVRMKLNGGIDLNSQMGLGESDGSDAVLKREGRPAITTDVFLGYEFTRFVQRTVGREKFAAKDSNRNQYTSPGSESYQAVIGSAGVTNFAGTGSNDWVDTESVVFAYHDPAAAITATNQPAQNHFAPPPETAGGNSVAIWVKAGYKFDANKAYVYYTTDGQTFPEGAAGQGVGSTRVTEMAWVAEDTGDNQVDWWRAVLPAMTNGTTLRYKIGLYRQQDGSGEAPWNVPFPSGSAQVAQKKRMLGEWEITNFNARTVAYKPHNDYGHTVTGLVEGFNVLSARAFLERDNRAALYNTFVQPFYFDSMTPTGQIIFPAQDGDDLGSQEYGAAVRVDPTVREVWFNILDSNPLNDDGATTNSNGNGLGTNGQPAWVKANFVTPSIFIDSPYPDEYRFTYRNIPASGMATIQVRLVELSSSTNFALGDAAGHYTTLHRIVDTFGPTQALFVAFPETDNQLINDQWDYVMKAWFSKSMDSNVTNFLIRINGSAQPTSAYAINFNIDANHHELAFTLPDLYNGDSNYVHQVEVIYTSNGGVQYQAFRAIRAYSQATGPYVSIVSPPEVDSVGKPYVITLPDVASPTPEQRQVPIQVSTDLSASNVWIEFANNAGAATMVASTETAVAGLIDVTAGTNLVVGRRKTLTGTVSATISNNTLTGSGTLFSNEVLVGNTILLDTNAVVVTQVVSQTSLRFADPYAGPSVTNVAAHLLPRFDVDFLAGDKVKIAGNLLQVGMVVSETNLLLTAAYPGSTASGLTAFRVDPNPKTTGSRKAWSFLWENIAAPGFYTFFARVDTNGVTNTVEASATRNVTIVFRETVAANEGDDDDDDDGLYDYNELTPTNHPSAYKNNSETWVNSDLHIWHIYGKTDPLSPDSDGDGLPDGLESGWRNALSATATNVDTDGDGFRNFLSDLDPPFYNTLDNLGKVPGVNTQNEGGDRSLRRAGTMTDPNNPDSDFDGIPDGVEDRNRNGWVDGDGEALPPDWDPFIARLWPNNVIDAGETWTETSPTKNDSDDDGLSDGYGEDKNFNGWIDGDTNSNRVWNAGELWTETDPLNRDTDGDSLPDGWEVQYGLDPWDNGVIGHTNLRTGLVITNLDHGASGNPDGDVVCNTTNAYSNLLEFQNNSNPRAFDSCAPLPEGSIVIGRGTNVLGVINGVTNYADFTDWTWDDLIVLDEYEGGGNNNQGGDLYLGWDGFDTSRDLVAFYARDGGPDTGDFYFRVDLHDLQPLAEEGFLDLYVVIDTGNPAAGELALPDDVDMVTSMRWECVVAVYQSGNGAVYVDTNPGSNSSSVGQNLTPFGVERRDQNAANGFKASYYNADLDAVEFSIKRQALLDAGWNGNPDSLNYQVFSTKDGTCNGCGAGGTAGGGDIGGRNDCRDTIYDDHVAEDYWQNQPSIQNALVNYFNRGTFAGRAKVAMVVHANQAIQPGHIVQNLVNNGQGAGYVRLLDIHDIYDQPVNLHITPTLASALQWAKVDPSFGTPWRDGPSFNARIRDLAQTNVVRLLASTFADHVMPYFTPDFNRDNDRLSREFLQSIYGVAISSNNVFWPPERVLDADVFGKILDLGYTSAFVDQDTHLFYWLGRTPSLSDSAYRINRINGVKTFVLNNSASGYRFQNNDNGLNMPLRGLLSRKARSGQQDQVVVLLSNWEDFGSGANADAYDKNVRWIANHPWVQLVALQDILEDQVNLNADSPWYAWGIEERGNAATNKLSHNYIQHAARGNFDHWYVGLAGAEHGLQTNRFEIRPGVQVPGEYGMLYFGGVVSQAWGQVNSVADTNLGKLARGALHASTFETAFHSEDNNNLERFSIGTYVSADTTFDGLADFAKQAQAQSRVAAIYERVDSWAAIAAGVTTPQAVQEDADLDGEDEYLLYNDRLFGVFERVGGRLIGAWVRDVLSGRVFQALGNQVGFAGSETEYEGAFNTSTNLGFGAYRTSGLKDWFGTKNGGTSQYVNDLYTFTNWTNGWRAVSSDGDIAKIVTLQPKSGRFDVQYTLAGGMAGQTLYVRHGLSPNLYDLLLNGQATLSGEQHAGGVLTLANTGYQFSVEANIGYADGGHNASAITNAVDDNPGQGIEYFTLNMRNQAQTHQVELSGAGTFGFSLGFRAYPSDWDGDGIPNDYEDQYGFLDPANASDGEGDEDIDRFKNWQEYVAGTDPNNAGDFFHASQFAKTNASGIVVRFPTKAQREYHVLYANGGPANNQAWQPATTNPIPGTGGTVEWVDDGTLTAPAPTAVTGRTYQIRVQLPQ